MPNKKGVPDKRGIGKSVCVADVVADVVSDVVLPQEVVPEANAFIGSGSSANLMLRRSGISERVEGILGSLDQAAVYQQNLVDTDILLETDEKSVIMSRKVQAIGMMGKFIKELRELYDSEITRQAFFQVILEVVGTLLKSELRMSDTEVSSFLEKVVDYVQSKE